MAVLMGMSGDVKGKAFPIDGDELTIGRSSDNIISLNNATVSGHHASIRREGDRYVLRDLGSTNGTRVNSHEVKESALRPKDIVQVGSVEFLFNAEAMGLDEEQPDTVAKTEVLESKGSSAMPETFGNISPFGARRRENLTLWIPAIVVLGVLAVGLMIFLFYKLFAS